MQPINFYKWIEEHRELFTPPVRNKCLWQEGDFIVMVVGGPNARTDFHHNPFEELFYQIQGDITLRVRENNQYRDICIREGEMLLLPAHVPHSPKRPANTIGLVIERVRGEQDLDGFQWFCKQCDNELHFTRNKINDIEKDLLPIFDSFHHNKLLSTCNKCGAHATREV